MEGAHAAASKAGKGPPGKGAPPGKRCAGKGPPGKGCAGKGPPPSKDPQGACLSYKEQREKKQRELEDLLAAPPGFTGRDGLTPEELRVMAEQGTEELYHRFRPTRGHFACRRCGNPVYSHGAKLECASGRPAFDRCYEGAAASRPEGGRSGRAAVSCAGCGALLGHACAEEGGRGSRTGQRQSAESAALQYVAVGPPEAKPETTLPLEPPRPEEKRLGLVVQKEYPMDVAGAALCVSSGTLVDFEGDAVVNAANQALAAGEGINGALRAAGGPRLVEAMEAVPAIGQPDGRAVRCPPGEVRLTVAGDLAAEWCIHAVGPNYEAASREGRSVKECDALLASAYRNAMACAEARGIKTLAFALLSSGIFRGDRSLQALLDVGVGAVRAGAYAGLKEVHLVTFGGGELPELLAACDGGDIRTLALENASRVHPGRPVPADASPFSWDREAPALWLGSRKVAESVAALRLLRVSHVVNCAASQVSSPLLGVEEEGARSVKYCRLDLDDAPCVGLAGKCGTGSAEGTAEASIPFDPRAPEAFERAADFIHGALRSEPSDGMGGPVVLVHCAGGVSRSCCVVLAYLVTKLRLTLRDAHAQVKQLRPVIAPNAGFFCLLLDMEKAEHGVETMRRPLTVHQRDYEALEAESADAGP